MNPPLPPMVVLSASGTPEQDFCERHLPLLEIRLTCTRVDLQKRRTST